MSGFLRRQAGWFWTGFALNAAQGAGVLLKAPSRANEPEFWFVWIGMGFVVAAVTAGIAELVERRRARAQDSGQPFPR